MKKEKTLFLMALLIVSCIPVQASISINSDTIKAIWQNGVNFIASESMDKAVTPFIQQDSTIRDKGFAKIVAGVGIVIGERHIVQKNYATHLICNAGWNLCCVGAYDLLWPWSRKELALNETATIFTINSVVKPIVIDNVEKNSNYSRAESQVAVNSAQIIASTYMLYSQDPYISRIYRNVRFQGVKGAACGYKNILLKK